MASLRELKAILKSKIESYFKNEIAASACQNIEPEFIAEEMLNKYPRDFSNYRRKNFKKFVTIVRFCLQEIDFETISNIGKNKNDVDNASSSNYDSHTDDDYSMPESTHNLNDWITSTYQKASSPTPTDCYVIDKMGDKNLKRKETVIENKVKKKVKSEDESFIKIAVADKEKPAKLRKPYTNTKDAPKAEFEVLNPECDFSELDGLDDVISKIKCYLQIYSLGKNKLMRRGFLFSGAAGTGKSTLAKCISHQLKLPLLVTSSTQLLDGLPSERGEKVDKLFAQALTMQPCFVLIEKLELFLSDSKEGSMPSLLSERLIKNIDDLNEQDSDVWLLATTSKVENLDPQLLKGRRFQKTFQLPLPNLSKRVDLLEKYINIYLTKPDCSDDVIVNKAQATTTTSVTLESMSVEEGSESSLRVHRPVHVHLADDCTFRQLAEKTPSFSAPDLKILVEEALIHSLNRHLLHAEELLPEKTPGSSKENLGGGKKVELMMADFEKALCSVKASTMSEDVVSVPEVTWQDIGALDSIREDISWLILKHIKHPEVFERDRLPLQGGVMLYGPPGCGKTLIAKAIANEACLNFISVAGPELKNKYVGESEKNIRAVFSRAQECAPCLIFFDEIDSLCSTRSFSSESSGGISVVQQMLTELDGVRERKGVYVMGATNRIDQVDPAFLRENRYLMAA